MIECGIGVYVVSMNVCVVNRYLVFMDVCEFCVVIL